MVWKMAFSFLFFLLFFGVRLISMRTIFVFAFNNNRVHEKIHDVPLLMDMLVYLHIPSFLLRTLYPFRHRYTLYMFVMILHIHSDSFY